jgi:hypothetical protein
MAPTRIPSTSPSLPFLLALSCGFLGRTCRHAACKRLSKGFMARVFESRQLSGRESSGMLLMQHQRFSPQSGEKPHLINMGGSLNQRVQGSSPCAPTNKIN